MCFGVLWLLADVIVFGAGNDVRGVWIHLYVLLNLLLDNLLCLILSRVLTWRILMEMTALIMWFLGPCYHGSSCRWWSSILLHRHLHFKYLWNFVFMWESWSSKIVHVPFLLEKWPISKSRAWVNWHFYCWKSRNDWEWRLPLFTCPEKDFHSLAWIRKGLAQSSRTISLFVHSHGNVLDIG